MGSDRRQILDMIRRCGCSAPLTSHIISDALSIPRDHVERILEGEASAGQIARIVHNGHAIWVQVAHIPAWRDRQSRKSCTDYANFT